MSDQKHQAKRATRAERRAAEEAAQQARAEQAAKERKQQTIIGCIVVAIIVVLVLTFAMYAYLKYSKQGYEISVVGESENTARYAGINVRRVTVRTMLISGAICGLIGLLLTAGTDHTLTTTIVGGRGFTAVMVSWMAKFNPIMMIFTSLLIVVLSRGASEISSVFSLNHSFADILTGIILFFIIGSEFFISYKVSLRKSKKEA